MALACGPMRLRPGPPERGAAGGVVEWLMALVLKTSEVKASVGSNPTPSVLSAKAPASRSSFEAERAA
jgi:hypothetical protein